MAFSLHGIKVPHRKNTAESHSVRMTASVVTIPTAMHIGKPATPVVKVGDLVKVGTLIAEQNGFVSSPVYASVSGKVTKVQDMLVSNGNFVPAITIESDGEMVPDESIVPPVVNSNEEFIEAIKKSGIVGLGGAGFPTYVKLSTDKPVDYLVINGAECEPYITSDTRTMLERGEDIKTGLEAILKFINVGKVVFAIEKNKKSADAEMQRVLGSMNKVEVRALPTIYPQGGEKVLVYHATKRIIGNGQLPIDAGCIVHNCTTVAAIGS